MVGRGGGAGGNGEYRLIVRGELDQRFAHLFEPMRLERADGTTVISGPVIDQAQLHGIIERIGEMGLDLLSVEQVDERS
jgi:hypothetical protein